MDNAMPPSANILFGRGIAEPSCGIREENLKSSRYSVHIKYGYYIQTASTTRSQRYREDFGLQYSMKNAFPRRALRANQVL